MLKGLLLFLLLFSTQVSSQDKGDSLVLELDALEEGTHAYCKKNIELALFYQYKDFEKTKKFATKALEIAKRLNLSLLQFQGNNILAVNSALRGNSKEALTMFLKNKSIPEDSLSANNLGTIYNNIGIACGDVGMYEESVENHLIGLKYRKESGVQTDVAASLMNIGLVYYRQKMLDKALKYFDECMVLIAEIEKDNPSKSDNYTKLKINAHNNIGLSLKLKGDLKGAKDHFEKATKIGEAENMEYAMLYSLQYHAGIYMLEENYDEVARLVNRAELIAEKIGDSYGLTLNKTIKANRFEKLGQLSKAITLYSEAVAFFKDNGSAKLSLDNLYALARVEAAAGDFKNSHAHLLESYQIKDSLDDDESKRLQEDLEFKYQLGEKEKEIALLDKEKELAFHQAENERNERRAEKAEAEKQKKEERLIMAGVISLVLIITGFVFYSLQQKKKNNRLLSAQKIAVEQKNSLLQIAKHEIEEKSKEIVDSITYAKRLQQAILPSLESFEKSFNEYFLMYRPKDIVAGDFYWLERKGNLILFAVADCTGHGVPGAMVSVVCSNALKRAVNEMGLIQPAQILDATTSFVIETFDSDKTISLESGDSIKDGMDISLCSLNLDTKELQWAGANNPLWIIKAKGDFINIKGDKQPIGKYLVRKPFTNHVVHLQSGDSLYLFSDGYADQFGGDSSTSRLGKKLKNSSFRRLLMSHTSNTMVNQKHNLEQFFDEWKGEFEQLDDVCVLGVKI